MKKLYWLLTMVLMFGLVLTACGGGNTTVAEPNVADNNTANVTANDNAAAVDDDTAAADDDAAAGFEVADLDAAFETFLAEMEGYNTISLDALNTALVENPPFLVDVRTAEEVEGSGYIAGAINLPLTELAESTAYLPSFDTPIVTYCGSGWRCTIALTVLEGMGWEDVKCLKGNSFGGWVEGGYAVEEGVPAAPEVLNAVEVPAEVAAHFNAAVEAIVSGWGGISADDLNLALIDNPELTLIDVRTAGEVESKGTIASDSWTNIPLEEFIADMADWPADLDSEIVVYCGSGHRSTIAMTILYNYGYTNVRSLKGGFGGWVSAGYETVGGTPAFDPDAAFSTFLADIYEQGYDTISLDALNAAMLEGNTPFLVDVRTVEEVEGKGHIEGAINLPLTELAESTAYLPSFDTPIVTYCGSGWRCTIALTVLEGMGWEDVRCLKGGSFGGWADGGYPVVEGLPAEPEMLNAVTISADVVAYFDAAVENLAAGWGGISADDFNLALIDNPDLIVIDARRTDELEANGVIESGAWTSIPLEEFIAGMADWPADKEAEIVVYCGSGHRSTIAMTILSAYGYTNVHSLKGGFGGWAAAGYPIADYVAP